MPTYEYKCEACDHGFEIVESITIHKERIKCPKCKKKKLNPVFSVPYAIIKGSDRESLGSFAERNTKRLGKELVAKKEESKSEKRNRPLPSGMESLPTPTKKKKVWWRKDDKIDTSLANLSPEKKQKFIATGEK